MGGLRGLGTVGSVMDGHGDVVVATASISVILLLASPSILTLHHNSDKSDRQQYQCLVNRDISGKKVTFSLTFTTHTGPKYIL